MRNFHLPCAKVLWEFSRLNHLLTKSDVMLVLGNDDPRTAEHAAELFSEGWAPIVIISGKEGTGTKGKIQKSEAEMFCDIMTSLGVPKSRILLETQATNTGENMKFSQSLLQSLGIQPASVLIVTKSVMELRAKLTFQKQWKGAEHVHLSVTSPSLSLEEYPSKHVGTLDDVVAYMVSTFEKLTLYAQQGHQEAVDIPAHVQKAYTMLADYFQNDNVPAER